MSGTGEKMELTVRADGMVKATETAERIAHRAYGLHNAHIDHAECLGWDDETV